MARRAKAQPSSIDRLPEAVRDEIATLRRGGRTIDEILGHLKKLGAEVSRSALGRHVKTMAEVGEEIRKAEAMAKFVVTEFGKDGGDERVGRANMAILQAGILEILTERGVDEETGEAARLNSEEAKALSLALQRLISSQRMDADRQMRLRAEARREALLEAASAVDKAAKAEGLTQATVDAMKARILGIQA